MAVNDNLISNDLVKENPSLSRTFLGGLPLNARIIIYVILGFIAFSFLGILFYRADQQTSIIINSAESSHQISSFAVSANRALLSAIDDSVRYIESNHQIFYANYKNNIVEATRFLGEVKSFEATQDVHKVLASIIDDLTEHSTHIENISRLRSLAGVGKNTEQIGKITAIGLKVGKQLLATRNENLINLGNSLSLLEKKVKNTQNPEITQTFISTVTNTRQSVIASSIKGKAPIISSLNSLIAQLESLTELYELISNQTEKIEALHLQISSNQDALNNFSKTLFQETKKIQETKRQHLRATMVAGTSTILFLLVLFGSILIRSITKPVNQLSRSARRLAEGDSTIMIPALENFDETGEIAIALSKFRENMIELENVRKELENYINNKKLPPSSSQLGEPAKTATGLDPSLSSEIDSPGEAKIPETPAIKSSELKAKYNPREYTEERDQNSPLIISKIRDTRRTELTQMSQSVAEISQEASKAAKSAERCDVISAGLNDSANKIAEIETLLTTINDHMSLLAVQTAITDDTVTDGKQDQVLPPSHEITTPNNRKISEFITDNLKNLQGSTKRAIRALQQVGQSIRDTRSLALDLAAETSNEALDAASKLLRQSEDLRSMLDNLLGKTNSDLKH